MVEEFCFWPVTSKDRADCTAAKEIASRQGVGKVKHLSLQKPWAQDHVGKGERRHDYPKRAYYEQ